MFCRLRRILYYLVFLMFIIWMLIAIIIIRFDTEVNQSMDEMRFIAQTMEAIKYEERVAETTRGIRDSHDQIVAPVIDDQKNVLIAPGEMGKGVEIDREKLSASDVRKYDDGFEKHAFNLFASDLISKHRTLPDVRDEGCRKLQYPTLMITASVVICFHDEAWSVLLRSIHSILDRSPRNLLKEIILVDDFSEMEYLKQSLDDYIKSLPMVKIIRQEKREGLVRSRLAGAAQATGDVLIFLDSHIEATDGWLEALLDPIAQNSTNVVTPMIDTIDDMTLKYRFGSADYITVGGFNWDLQFTWHVLPERERKRRQHPLEPVRTPTMAGGLFAIHREYFNYLGTYDSGMDIWGGENLEISFRIWMCGGTLLTAPCSHVGHIFRKRFPYKSIPIGNIVKKNSIRVAEVWLDEYKNNFYERFNYNLDDYGDVTERKLLRQKLQCKSFQWYLTEIYPELFIPNDAITSGEIRNMEVSFCVDGSTSPKSYQRPVVGYSCHNQGGNQYFLLTPIGHIRRDDGCLDYSDGMEGVDQNDRVVVMPCYDERRNQRWTYSENNQLYHPSSNLCLSLSEDHLHIRMQQCAENNRCQKWTWKRRARNNTDGTN